MSAERCCIRYSEAFTMQVIEELERGKLSSVWEASRRYGIKGTLTVRNWLLKYGRNHFVSKVIRVEKPDESNRMQQLREQVQQLEKALAQTQMESLLNRSAFEVLCKEVGVDPEGYKKKVVIPSSGAPRRRRTGK